MATGLPEKELRVIEFYSGIGGLHYALKACAIPATVVAAIDINTTANEVYSHNFPNTMLLSRNIEGIKLDDFKKLDGDAFIMSPPCQPFTRQGHQKASSDPRTKSFLHIIKMLKRLRKPPMYILMENVKGFEVSDTREDFIKTLEEANYLFQEFLLTPTQFGIPNSRLRYFLMAVQKPMNFPFEATESIMESLPVSLYRYRKSCSTLKNGNPRSNCVICSENKSYSSTEIIPNRPGNNLIIKDNEFHTSPSKQVTQEYYPSNGSNLPQCSDNNTEISTKNAGYGKQTFSKDHYDCDTIDDVKLHEQSVWNMKHFLELDKNDYKEFLLSEDILRTKVLLMDIVEEGCNHSCCFTKGYGHYVEGTGSVLQTTSVNSSLIFHQYSEIGEEGRPHLLAPLGLRYFTPREISNLHYFPKEFDFPQNISTKQKYRLLGNSLNVQVLSELMKLLFSSKKS